MTEPHPDTPAVPPAEKPDAVSDQPAAQPKPARGSGSESATLVWKRAPGRFGSNPVPRT